VPQGQQAVRTLDFPVRFSSSRAELHGDAPGLGQHTDEVVAELGLTKD
jgi:crotonobetainyl-CoA:carnitine CoA-transferase CaiB-like acyl-CoA transferase